MDNRWLVVGVIIAAAIFIIGVLCVCVAIIHAIYDLRATTRALNTTDSHEDEW